MTPHNDTASPSKNRFIPIAIVLLMVGAATAIMPAATAEGLDPITEALTPEPAETDATELLSGTGIYFEENLGQFPDHVRYVVHGAGTHAFLTDQGVTFVLSEAVESDESPATDPFLDPLALHDQEPPERREHAVILGYVDAHPAPAGSGQDTLPGISNHFKGNDPTKWVTNVPHYARVIQEDVWPGIDIEWYGQEGKGLKFDAIVHPGADPGQVQFTTAGAEDVYVDGGNRLVLETPLGPLFKDAPYTYQTNNGKIHAIQSRYKLDSTNHVSFDLGDHNPSQPLVIDPLFFSTFVGAYGAAEDVAIDNSGNLYLTGRGGTSYPTTGGAYNPSSASGTVAIVTKLNSDGSSLIYSTYIGGGERDESHAIAVDSSGNAYLAGLTRSYNFPTTSGAYDTDYWKDGGNGDGFVLKLSTTGSNLEYSTFIGGYSNDELYDIAVDSSGSAYVTGETLSINYPTTSGAYQPSKAGDWDAVVTKLNSAGSGLVYSTHLGGIKGDHGYGIAVDSDGYAFVVGISDSTDFPTTSSAYQKTMKGMEACSIFDDAPCNLFVTRLNPTGTDLSYSTYLGGSGSHRHPSIDIDPSGNAYVTGWTSSVDYPTKGALQPIAPGGTSSFVTKLNSAGSSLSYSTYLGGTGSDLARSIAVDSSGNAFVGGYSTSPSFPVTSGAHQTSNHGNWDAFVTWLNPTGTAMKYSTLLGGTYGDHVYGVAVDANDNVYLAGWTNSQDFPVTDGAYRTTRAPGGTNTFASRFAFSLPGQPLDFVVSCLDNGVRLTWDAPGWTAGSSITGYKIYYGLTNPPSNVVNAGGPSWDHVPTWTSTPFRYEISTVTSAGEGPKAGPRVVVPCDLVAPVASPDVGQLWSWTNSIPLLSGVSWIDDYSGLDDKAQYSVGTSSGATDVKGWTNLPTQPSNGQMSWSPSWSPSVLEQGLNYINVRVYDRYGTMAPTNGAYLIQYDTIGPIMDRITSPTHIDEDLYYSATTFEVSWTATDTHSGVDDYRYELRTSACPSSLSSGTATTGTSTSFSGLGPFQEYWFCIQARDTAGNWGPVASHHFGVDAVAPEFDLTFVRPDFDDVTTNPLQPIEIHYDDPDTVGGFDQDSRPRQTIVDAPEVTFFVDGIDMRLAWEPLCGPDGPFYDVACKLEITSTDLVYEPLVSWAEGAHDIVVGIQDTVEGANTASQSWSFTFDAAGLVPPHDAGCNPMPPMPGDEVMCYAWVELLNGERVIDETHSETVPSVPTFDHDAGCTPTAPGPGDTVTCWAWIEVNGDRVVDESRTETVPTEPTIDHDAGCTPTAPGPGDTVTCFAWVEIDGERVIDETHTETIPAVPTFDHDAGCTPEPPMPGDEVTCHVWVEVDGDRIVDESYTETVPNPIIDGDGDGVPDGTEPVLCILEDPEVVMDGHCDGTDYTPPTQNELLAAPQTDTDGDGIPDDLEVLAGFDPMDPDDPAPHTAGPFTVYIPAPGPDGDGDGFPAHMTMEAYDVSLDADAGADAVSMTRNPDEDSVHIVDEDDSDPSIPVENVVSASVPWSLTQGPDADTDGLPAYVTVEWSTVTWDRTDPANPVIERNEDLDQDVPIDGGATGNDSDPSEPVLDQVTVTVASNVVIGDDMDEDDVPKDVTVESSDVTVNRDGTHTVTRNPDADSKHQVDPDDGDAQDPVATEIRVTVPRNAGYTDADGDQVPGSAYVEFWDLVVNRTTPDVYLEENDDATMSEDIDPDDNDADNPNNMDQDTDEDGLPDDLEVIAGTDPNDPSDPVSCQNVIADGGAGVLVVVCGQDVPNVLIGWAPQCADFEDNDGDGYTDYQSQNVNPEESDPECTNWFDNDEAN